MLRQDCNAGTKSDESCRTDEKGLYCSGTETFSAIYMQCYTIVLWGWEGGRQPNSKSSQKEEDGGRMSMREKKPLVSIATLHGRQHQGPPHTHTLICMPMATFSVCMNSRCRYYGKC